MFIQFGQIRKKIHFAFEQLIQKFKNSIIIISYRADGIPSIRSIKDILLKHKKEVIE